MKKSQISNYVHASCSSDHLLFSRAKHMPLVITEQPHPADSRRGEVKIGVGASNPYNRQLTEPTGLTPHKPLNLQFGGTNLLQATRKVVDLCIAISDLCVTLCR